MGVKKSRLSPREGDQKRLQIYIVIGWFESGAGSRGPAEDLARRQNVLIQRQSEAHGKLSSDQFERVWNFASLPEFRPLAQRTGSKHC